MMFKDLQKLVATQQRDNTHIESCIKGCKANLSGYGINKSTSKKILEAAEIAALIISLVYRRRIEMTNHSMTMSKLYLIL
jgi:hypothetical protein